MTKPKRLRLIQSEAFTFSSKHLRTARMSAIAGNFGNIFCTRRFALRTAIFLVSADRTDTRFVSAFVGICHSLKNPPLFFLKIFVVLCDRFNYKPIDVKEQ
jgi:hypothetical protein